MTERKTMTVSKSLFEQFDEITGITQNDKLSELLQIRREREEQLNQLLTMINSMMQKVEHSNILLKKYEKILKERGLL